MDLPVKNIVSEIDLKPSDALLPLFESVVNSIHSLKLTKGLIKSKKKIQVHITRGGFPQRMNLFGAKTIHSFKVIDNGEGFTDPNLTSFKTAYSRKNKEFGCKGIGRFTILAGYEKIHVSSTFLNNGSWHFREFDFDTDEEVKILKDRKQKNGESKTIVELVNAKDIIREYTALTVEEIAEGIMEHCLIFYLCGDLPTIEVFDKDNEAVAVVNELYKKLSKDREMSLKIGKYDFKYYITKSEKVTSRKHHYIHYCANSRIVGEGRSIAKVNSLFAFPITENGKDVYLDIYVVSDFLNKKVFSARNGFDIPQDRENTLFSSFAELTFQEIETSIAKQLEEEYDSFVKETQNRNIREVTEYIKNKAPRYNRFLRRQDVLESIPPNLSDDKKEEFLYKVSFNERKAIDNKIQKFIDDKDINEQAIVSVKQQLIEKTEFDSDCLTDYMFRRKAIIDLFKKFLEADREGKYRLEQDIHNLIFPMGVSLDDINYESHNLWLLDERFATFTFIDSDKPITGLSQKHSRKEPDLLMVNNHLMVQNPQMFDNPISFSADPSGKISSMVIFEFKRPGDTAHNKKKGDRWKFSELIEKYFDEFLYARNKKNYKGRQVILEQSTPKFGYVIVDVIPPALESYNLTQGFKRTPFDTLYFINPDLNMHLEVITFEQLLRGVEKRHAPFFDKLFSSTSVKHIT